MYISSLILNCVLQDKDKAHEICGIPRKDNYLLIYSRPVICSRLIAYSGKTLL